MADRTTSEKPNLLFLTHGRSVVLFHTLSLLVSYGMVWFIYPLTVNASADADADPLNQTFFMFIILSGALSFILFFIRSHYAAVVILFFRCYLIMVQGYGLPGFFTFKLILGIAVLLETGILLKKPLSWINSAVFIAGILFSQVYNPVFGINILSGAGIFASVEILLSMLFVFAVVAICISLMVAQSDSRESMRRNMLTQRESLSALAEFNTDLQAYARKVDAESSDRERNRISREIHDISGYIFTNLIALLNAACSIPPSDQEELLDILITARKQAQEGLNETRTALRKTRETPIPEEEGIRAINKIILIFQKVTGVRVNVNWGNAPRSFSRELNFALYRTIQEALTNAYRHGMGTEIMIHFLIENSILKISIIDNGIGSEEVVKGIGLTGMDERIGNFGGNVTVNKAPGGGFSLNVAVPLKQASQNKNRELS